jgi:hypothetical protein
LKPTFLKTSWIYRYTHSSTSYSLIQIFFFVRMDLYTLTYSNRMGFFFSQSSKIAQANLETKKNFSWLLDFLKDFLRLNLWYIIIFFSIVGREKKVNWIWKFFFKYFSSVVDIFFYSRNFLKFGSFFLIFVFFIFLFLIINANFQKTKIKKGKSSPLRVLKIFSFLDFKIMKKEKKQKTNSKTILRG